MVMKRLVTKFLLLSVIGACASEVAPEEAPASEVEALPASVQAEVDRLSAELADVPGDLVVTRSSQFPFSDELTARVVRAGKVIHIFNDNRVVAYVGADVTPLPEGVPPQRRFREHGGEIVVADQLRLPAYLGQQESQKLGVPLGVGLVIGNGAQWPESTVAYTLDGALTTGERDAIVDAITAWNASTDLTGTQMRVRFVPRYWADNRPFVSFVRGGPGCGSSQVGRHDNIFTNWWSHNITLNCFDRGTIQHEMGHTAGLWHEQQRCDRDQFVTMGVTGGTDCAAQCDAGYARTYGAYNYLSVMHYFYSTRTDACAISQRVPSSGYYRGQPWQGGTATQLDAADVSAINEMYSSRPALPQIGAGRYYHIVPAHASWKAIIAGGGTTVDGAQLIQWDRYPGWADQQVSVHNLAGGFVEIRMRHDNKCLEIYGFSAANGGALVQWSCWGGTNQQWIVAPNAGAPGTFDVMNRHSNKSLDVPGASTANGVGIQQWDHNNGANQRFLLIPAT
jgi:Astacin (Peptidase family M12A)/Ricin-type beta-trefoil lectin domain-like